MDKKPYGGSGWRKERDGKPSQERLGSQSVQLFCFSNLYTKYLTVFTSLYRPIINHSQSNKGVKNINIPTCGVLNNDINIASTDLKSKMCALIGCIILDKPEKENLVLKIVSPVCCV